MLIFDSIILCTSLKLASWSAIWNKRATRLIRSPRISIKAVLIQISQSVEKTGVWREPRVWFLSPEFWVLIPVSMTIDLQKRLKMVWQYQIEGSTAQDIAGRFQIDRKTVENIYFQFRTTWSVTPDKGISGIVNKERRLCENTLNYRYSEF